MRPHHASGSFLNNIAVYILDDGRIGQRSAFFPFLGADMYLSRERLPAFLGKSRKSPVRGHTHTHLLHAKCNRIFFTYLSPSDPTLGFAIAYINSPKCTRIGFAEPWGASGSGQLVGCCCRNAEISQGSSRAPLAPGQNSFFLYLPLS